MADFQAPVPRNAAAGKPRASRMPTRIDFTPMVDLGFLLITFFMLTTMLTKPNVMPLVMPKEDGENEPVKASKVLTILLGASDKVFWYEGLEVEKMDSTTFDAEGLRQVILRKRAKVDTQFGLENYRDSKSGETLKGSQVNIIVKPCKASRYKNLVDALDEMAICQVRYYCVMDPSGEEEKQW